MKLFHNRLFLNPALFLDLRIKAYIQIKYLGFETVVCRNYRFPKLYEIIVIINGCLPKLRSIIILIIY